MIPDSPFTLDAAKEHLRVRHVAEDALITRMLDAAVQRCEQYTGIAWTERAEQITFVPLGEVYASLPIVRVKPSTMAVTYLRNDDTKQPYAADTWTLRNVRNGQTVLLRSIPSDLSPEASEYAQITYTAEPPTAVPQAVFQAAMLYLGDLYANRESQIVGTISTPNKTAEALLDPFRITWGI